MGLLEIKNSLLIMWDVQTVKDGTLGSPVRPALMTLNGCISMCLSACAVFLYDSVREASLSYFCDFFHLAFVYMCWSFIFVIYLYLLIIVDLVNLFLMVISIFYFYKKIAVYHEKQVTLRVGHIWEREGKRRTLRRWVWLRYSVYKNEYRIFKSVEPP
jgi:hypothetical protein